MIIKSLEVEKFRAINNMKVNLGKNITAISGRNATLKTTLLGMIGQPFTISKGHPMYGCTTIDGYNFKSQFKEKFKLSKEHDHVGQHSWTLNLYNKGYYMNNEIKLASIKRPTKANPKALRFWNAKSKAKGSGYVQLPVYYLSLSRLFPIGETRKTKTVNINLTEEENQFFIHNYKKILSIQNSTNACASMEKADSKRSFIGINDDTHDVFTNSAGESNIGRIILAILSFMRLKKQCNQYKGGILLIDELDATLYGYSQKKLIHFLYDMCKECKIQIVFTTHSPIILKEVNNLQRREAKKILDKGLKSSEKSYNYECEIIYLESDYMEDGVRLIKGENVSTAARLNEIIDDINLNPTTVKQNVNVYLEDDRAKSFLEFLLNKVLNYNYENYINIIDVDLGWSNYVQLHQKKVPEFLNSVIVLDQDVKIKSGKKLEYINKQAKNIIFLPVDVEAGIFKMLKDHAMFKLFEEIVSQKGIRMTYDICFRDWVDSEYDSLEYKKWFKYMEETLGEDTIMFEFWYSHNEKLANMFVYEFIDSYNVIAESLELDYMTSD